MGSTHYLWYIKQKFTNKVFEAISSYSPDSDIRYVGGCIRKIINKEKVDDIDLATNLEPKEVCMALEKNNIKNVINIEIAKNL